jgi:hypothetical protein
MNDEMEMKGGSGTKCKPQYSERMLNVLIRIFLHQMRKRCLEFALPNQGEICKHLAGAYGTIQTVTHRGLSSLGRYVFGSEISYNKAPPRLPGLGC